ncbi:hypothetical protein HYS47_04480 [Candidatus Woesearchaeota archaeon]|nr:hypothetical protein [Candidatus Woesearchaeota archaeon]
MVKKRSLITVLLVVSLVLVILLATACGKGKGKVINSKNGNGDSATVDDIDDGTDDELADDSSFLIEDIGEEEAFAPKDPNNPTCEEVIKQAEVDYNNAKKRFGKAGAALLKATNALDDAQEKKAPEAELKPLESQFNAALKVRNEARDEVARLKVVYNQVQATVTCP